MESFGRKWRAGAQDLLPVQVCQVGTLNAKQRVLYNTDSFWVGMLNKYLENNCCACHASSSHMQS